MRSVLLLLQTLIATLNDQILWIQGQLRSEHIPRFVWVVSFVGTLTFLDASTPFIVRALFAGLYTTVLLTPLVLWAIQVFPTALRLVLVGSFILALRTLWLALLSLF